MRHTVILMLAVLCAGASAAGEPLSVRYFQTDQRYNYRIELLTLALEKTLKSHGPYVMEPAEQRMTPDRGLAFLTQGRVVNVAFLPTSMDRENRFLPIKIPILRGILGYRVFLIHRDNEPRFSEVKTLDQLKQWFSAGFGAQWADLEILKKNGIQVVKTPKYENLFIMLENKRFDYFPRGINEAWREIAAFSTKYPHLVVDSTLAFYYPYPVYFFVNKENVALAERIETGLSRALEDGSFKALFLSYHKALIDTADLDQRRLFRLDNPSLPPGTPEPDTGWWLND